ncbi:hypothetical protein HMPREF0758_0360 [Serratia odorifera DSM 4582]|uniref:Uncharacterized protein n=1 Tax=Serratia odorifera DSM 4582 TaxID=667129 RepID=D4DWR0_SEROD|nr:hypothetical protein HMPREF0758_0360 [Serratia odorifera DSM 4582]
MLTNTGRATNKPFCPMPSSPAQKANGQLEGDVFPLERISDDGDVLM